ERKKLEEIIDQWFPDAPDIYNSETNSASNNIEQPIERPVDSSGDPSVSNE
ncbi:unnamed protein product, partial [Rotaria sordida]